MPNASLATTDAPQRVDARRLRALMLRIVATFAAVLAIALALGLLVESLIAPVGSTTLDRHITDWVFTNWRTRHGLTVMTRVSWIGGPILVVPVTIAVTLALLLLRRWRLAQFFVVTVVGVAALSALARAIIDPRRPPGELGLRHPFASSFPSGHAAAATATYVAIGIIVTVLTRSLVLRVLVWILVAALIAGVCVARVYLAVHWTTDVLVGVTIGTLWVLGMARAFRVRPARTAPT